MATKKKTNTGKDNRDTWHGFVNHHLTETDKANVKRLVEDSGDLLHFVSECVESGYNFSLKWDNVSDCYTVVMMCREAKDENYGWAMSGRHYDFSTALAMVRYQHENLSDENNAWPKPTGIGSELDW